MNFPRSTGILLHPISLPSRGGIGDLGPAAYEFLDFLAQARQSLWQVLPLNPPANGNSPYSSISAFAGNPLLISLERLAERGWLDRSMFSTQNEAIGPIDYEQVRGHKLPLLRHAANNFLNQANQESRGRYDKFCGDNAWWLEDFVLFDAFREKHGNNWHQWPAPLARRESSAIESERLELDADLSVCRVLQFFFWEQWRALRHYCAKKSIRVVGDIAIFVDYESADVWAHRDLFRLRDDLLPEVVSGVPPDYFSATGQRWGNPLYNWETMRHNGYRWWIQRLRWATQTCDFIRLDHFRGFAQFWEIPADEPTAIKGRWVDGPGDEFFFKLNDALGGLPFVAEDLGLITPDVVALRDRHNIPGMAVLQFAFGDVGAHAYLPHRLTANHVIYTGTHDNDTTLGWWSALSEKERSAVIGLIGDCNDGPNWGLIRLAQSSPANFSIVPLQDFLSLGSEARLNTPSTHTGNYHWRCNAGALKPELAAKLAALAEVTDRVPDPVPVPPAEDFVA
ncbi:MAG TPA: 4-alpha-glucanotransferase [Terriglobales bacterium]|jgi:4-alpha-glucanotransferase|nr:4-alpha-glucanotransferase [Terriglobales bacterium]